MDPLLFRRRSTLRTVQPPILTLAAGVPDTSRGRGVILSSQSRLSLGTIWAIGIWGLTDTESRIQIPESWRPAKLVFLPLQMSQWGSQQTGGGLGDRGSEWRAGNLQDRVLQRWAIRRKRSGFRDAPIAQHTQCHPGAAPASSTLRDNNFRTLARSEHRPHA